MREQYMLYVQTTIATSMKEATQENVVHGSILFSLKALLNQTHQISSLLQVANTISNEHAPTCSRAHTHACAYIACT